MTDALNGAPGYWMHETSGVLRPVVEKFLNGKILTSEEIATMRAYLLQWILSPVWSIHQYSDEESRQTLWELRVRARHLETMNELHQWLTDALDFGMDPL